VNMARVFALAQIRFINGQEAFDHAHDWIGLLAFVVSGLFFYFLSGGLSTVPRQVVVRTLGRALE